MTSYWTRIMRGYQRLQQDSNDDYDEGISEIPMSSTSFQNRFSRRPPLTLHNILRFIRHHITFRRIAIFSAIVFFIISGTILSSGIPPRYDDIWEYERNLPQHMGNASLDVSLGKRKYLRFEGGVQGRGLNNVLQEALMMSYVAYLTHRAFVFEDYVWSLGSPFSSTIDNWGLRPSRIPFNAFISGPTTGGPITGQEHSLETRSVNLEFFDSICPTDKRVILRAVDSPSEHEIVDWWVEKLKSVEEEPCVVVDSSKVVFDIEYFADPEQIIPAFESLRTSPVLTDFTWSPLILSAIPRNFVVLRPPNLKDLYDQSKNSTIKGLIAVHLRRGDFHGHCLYLLKNRIKYMGLNTYPGIPDLFDAEGYLHNTTDHYPESETEQNRILKPYYFEHCLPEIDQIVTTLRNVRKDNISLDLNRVYILSNGKASWLKQLEEELRKDGWADIKSSIDLRLDSQQKYVSGAIDMAIAEKAEVFIGNGFSSLSSNIVMLRLAKGLPPNSNRLF